MKPVEFPEQNITWAKNQPQYRPLPAYSNDEETISCWSLSWRERLTVLWTGRVWMRLVNFGRPLTPSMLQTESPFETVREKSTALGEPRPSSTEPPKHG